jgi:hypothetical protein
LFFAPYAPPLAYFAVKSFYREARKEKLAKNATKKNRGQSERPLRKKECKPFALKP